MPDQLTHSSSHHYPFGSSLAQPGDVRRARPGLRASLLQALGVVLVFLVVFVFLQSFRATLIPMLAVPVSILGTFGALLAFGFSALIGMVFGFFPALRGARGRHAATR